jgi:ribonuclease HI
MNTNIEHVLMFDGGSRGNPGLCGSGFALYENNEVIYEGSSVVSLKNTNNYAEYMALINGLNQAKTLNIKHLSVKGDSLLVINQVLGKFKISSSNLKPLYHKVIELISYFDHIEFIHVGRHLNKTADKLANLAMDSVSGLNNGIVSRASIASL